MIRQRQRKNIEELYGGKFDAPKSLVTATAHHQNSGRKPGRFTARDFTSSPNRTCNGAALPISTSPALMAVPKSLNSGKETTRRKSARPSNKIPNEKHCAKEIFCQKDGTRSPTQTTKGEKLPYISSFTNVCENKTFGNYKEISAEDVRQRHPNHQHHQHNHHNHTHNSHDEEKDDDTDEFFDLIRSTVENAIGKSISELLNRNFRELSSKVERFSSDLKNTNAMLYQLQKELNNKIGHYGEENSRHFRYLCMKSEYDKMFYQHQTLISGAKPPNDESPSETINTERKSSKRSLTKMQSKECDKANSVACMKCKSKVSEVKEPHNSSSGDISQKSSEFGIREVLEYIQKFYTQMQFNESKCEQSSEGPTTSQQRNRMRQEDSIKINKEVFAENDEADEDDEVWEISSDGMTPRNRSINSRKYGGNTTRGDTTQRGNNGAGDA